MSIIFVANPDPTATLTALPETSMWTQRLSASFGALAEQITAASHTLASVESPASEGSAPVETTSALSARLSSIERTQERLSEELETIRNQIERLQVHEKEREKGKLIIEEEKVEGSEQDSTARAMEEMQKKVDGILETIRLDQARLYARLLNATIKVNKMAIQPLVMTNGKTPANFPATKGEFECLTKERYEHLLKSYDQPIKGDTAAKREAIREFLGLPPAF
ncbi:hypothetical protein AcW1_002349 [Taiwanofungus camphoratus]|nr:hypothetical protein AcV5_010355 [Antrodia cinnamomea]KAI0937986.1 hypothetical protein AcV7_003305 [Antrodia cinnamomea]KAI0944699.1 hypothetical protein AcW1_002349 [Antrodia cinnamomea]